MAVLPTQCTQEASFLEKGSRRVRSWSDIPEIHTVRTVLAQSSNFRVISIAQGQVRGHLEPDGGVYAFYNIPYATAPTGINRFKAPLPPPVWMHTLDAVDRDIICPQPNPYGLNSTMQEDCLVANVFVPTTNETNLPVAVIIHGGAYQYMYGNFQKYNALVQTSKLIVVTFNYRLAAHGFLCLGTKGAPGNAGLKDQVALLRWVNNNIASFGGNPKNVAVIGCSAGGGSAELLSLSKTTTGLFNKAIVDSGAAFGIAGIQLEPILEAQTYAKALNFNKVDDLDALEEFYTTISFEELFSQDSMVTSFRDASIMFAPCLERDVGEERVFVESPIDVIEQGNYTKIPLLYGFAQMEGLIVISLFESFKPEMNENFADFLPRELHFESQEIKEKVAEMVKKFYFGDQPVSGANILSYIDYFSDILFAYPMLKGLKARMESQNDTIYLHEYSFIDENTPSIPHTDKRGADHCAQIFAVADEDKTNITDAYRLMKSILRENWLNFIVTGAPSVSDPTLPVWLPANANRAPYMSFGTPIELKSSILLEKRAAFWDDIYEQYYRGPIPLPALGASGSFRSSNVVVAWVLLGLYLTSE